MTGIERRIQVWFDGNPFEGVEDETVLLRDAAAEIKRLREANEDWHQRVSLMKAEAEALAANQCHDGYGDEYGNHRCREIDALRNENAQLRAERRVYRGEEKAVDGYVGRRKSDA